MSNQASLSFFVSGQAQQGFSFFSASFDGVVLELESEIEAEDIIPSCDSLHMNLHEILPICTPLY